jgi:excisionase family DNA binding protein
MQGTTNAVAERIGEKGASRELIDVRDVAALLDCSVRHVRRLADAGRMPRPLTLGSLVRWRRAELSAWIDRGCPSMRSGAGQ